MTGLVTVLVANQPAVVSVQNDNALTVTLQESPKIINLVGNPVAISGGSGDYLNFNQATPAAVWTINHNFGRKPNVSVYTAGGLEVLAEIIHLSTNTTQITLDSALSGFAILS